MTGTVPVDCSGTADQCSQVMSRLGQFATDNGFDIQFRAATRWEIFRNFFADTTLQVSFVPDQSIGGGLGFGGHGGNGYLSLNGSSWSDGRVPSIVAHEFGHNLGLIHNDNVGSLMYGIGYPWTPDTLLPGERKELLNAYK